MHTRSLPFPLAATLAHAWHALAVALAPRRLDAPLELSERTLDDIGAPEWLRAQARVERDEGVAAWLRGRPWG